MCRRILTISSVVLVAIAVPLGAAFSFDRGPLLLPETAILDHAVSVPRSGLIPSWPEPGNLALAGGVLLGLASLVRRSA
jgi:hypothetical protein